MAKSRQTFSPEFKLEAAQLVLDQGYIFKAAKEAVGVVKSTLEYWMRQFREERKGKTPTSPALTGGTAANPGAGKADSAARNGERNPVRAKRNPEERELRERVKAAHQMSNGSAGARIIALMISAQRLPLSRYRAARRMRALGLVSNHQPAHRYKTAEQPHVGMRVTSPMSGREAVGVPGEVMDLFARKPVGRALSLTPDSELAKKALVMAYESRGAQGSDVSLRPRLSVHKPGPFANSYGATRWCKV